MKHLSAREQRTHLLAADRQLAALNEVLADLDATWCHPIPADGIPDVVAAAWNHLHDAHRELTEHRSLVEINPRDIPGREQGTAELVARNID